LRHHAAPSDASKIAMTPKVRKLTTPYSIATAVVSFIMQPIPAADELAVVPMHYWFAAKVAKAHGVRRRDLPWRSIQKIIWYGAGARLGANFSLGLVPVVGAFANAVTAAALTEYLAGWLDGYLADPSAPPPDISMEALMKIFERAQKTAEAQPS
jgi:uncharacterized protein (DUF697 family)